MRDNDSKSSMSRVIRCACWRMMSRKRSRAAGSLRAGPCRVSTKPSSDASGVRSSWLALATKSVRMASRRRADVRSRKNSTTPDARVAIQRLRPERADMNLEGPLAGHMLGIFDAQRLAGGQNGVDAVEDDGGAESKGQWDDRASAPAEGDGRLHWLRPPGRADRPGSRDREYGPERRRRRRGSVPHRGAIARNGPIRRFGARTALRAIPTMPAAASSTLN